MTIETKNSSKSRLVETLGAEFVRGKIPTSDDLFGGPDVHAAEWQVVMLTGFLPNMGGRLLRHRKRFMRTTDGNVVGYNLFRDDWRWGWFKLDTACRAMFIDYGVPENGVLLRRRIQDFVRTTLDPNVLIGGFYLKLGDTFRFVGYFHLVRLPAGKP